jgi:hypothetical protein
MPRILGQACRRASVLLFGLLVLGLSVAGCASMSQDVDAYYRQMAYNYKEAAEKAKMDAVTLENESKMLRTFGEFSKYRRAQRELEKIKAWEERCEKQEERFAQAAEWTEEHFHLEKPVIAGRSKAPGPDTDPAVSQASGSKQP